MSVTKMTYPEVIQYLESFINYEKISNCPYKKSFKLERIREFLDTIGNPQDSLRCIHVAGSKGKGSTCAFISYILRDAGFKVGLYTSPHLSDFRERIRILSPAALGLGDVTHRDFEGMIPEEELVALVKNLRPSIEAHKKNSRYGALSFFEVYTALALVYFKEQKVDLSVLETGLGGRLDATNVVNPLVCVLTSISYEHTQKLGNTLREIAMEKAGIIKRDAGCRMQDMREDVFRYPLPVTRYPVVISAPQEKEAARVIRGRCKEMGAELYEVGRDITYRKTKRGFNVKGILGNYVDLKTRLLGKHQLINASVAIGAVRALNSYDICVDASCVRRGLYNAIWPGRCEIISKDPFVVLDGAQNTASAAILKKAIKDNFKYDKLILVLGISKDKDIRGICLELKNLGDRVILTRAENPRACNPKVLCEYFNGKPLHIAGNVRAAKSLAFRIAKKRDLILVTGSLFVVGEFRNG